MQNTETRNLFHTGEDLAVKYLIHKGFKILERNYRIQGGEIDIIAQNEDTLISLKSKPVKNTL